MGIFMENRKAIRIEINEPCVIDTDELIGVEGTLLDISIAGMGFASNEVLKTKDIISIMTNVNGSEINVKGEIVFSYKSGDIYRYGLAYRDIEEKDLTIIAKYIKKEIVEYLSESEI